MEQRSDYWKNSVHDANFKDLMGQRFGRLIAIVPIGLNKNGNTIWQCKCDCGSIKNILNSSLTSGRTKSCGCLRSETTSKRQFKNLIDMRFGMLRIIEYIGKDDKGHSKWKCICDCGNETCKISSDLISGVQSCGCLLITCRLGDKHWNWKGGISYEPYCPLFNDDLRRRIRLFFDNECVLCGKSTKENGQELSCHHVEYNKSACCDGLPVHFAALCKRCHTKTNNNRSWWETVIHRIIDEIYDGRSYYTKEEYKYIHRSDFYSSSS